MAQAKQDMGSGSVKKPVPFCKIFRAAQKAENPGTAAPQTRGLECEKVLTPTGFFAILYKVYHGDVSKRS